MKYTVSYAQNREDIIINAFFDDKPTGFYVDVGANHPTLDSVTKLFYNKGWRGINIEPNQELLKLLEADRPEDVHIGKGVGATETTATFRNYEGADGLSTFADSIKNLDDEYYSPFKQKYTDEVLEITTLAKIFEYNNVEYIDFMKVDVEGFEYEVLAGNNWENYKPELICIESNHIVKDWRPFLIDNNYQFFFNDGLNDYYAQKSSPFLKSFSYPEKVFMRFPTIVPFIPHKELSDPSINLYDESAPPVTHYVSARTKILWSLTGLKSALTEGLMAGIVHQKRMMLHSRIGHSLKIGDVTMNEIKKRYITPRLVMLRVSNLSVSIGIKILGRFRNSL